MDDVNNDYLHISIGHLIFILTPVVDSCAFLFI